MKTNLFVLLALLSIDVFSQLKINSSGYIGLKTTNPLCDVQIQDDYTRIAIGKVNSITDGLSYVGFNALRQANGEWISLANNGKNGGSVIYSDQNGNINFVSLSSIGSNNQIYSNSYLLSKTSLKIGPVCFLATGTSTPPSGVRNYLKGWKTLYENTLSNCGVLHVDVSNTKPRLYNTYDNLTTAIVLINPNTGYFQDIELRNVIQNSDIHVKQNVTSLQSGLQKVLQLRPVSFNWMGESVNSPKSYGFIAQEVEQILPDLIFTTDSNQMKSMNYIGIIPYLVCAIQEQQKIIITQQQKIEEFKEVLSLCCENVIKNKNSLLNNQNKKGDIQSAYLLQNTPNPFNSKTTIYYYIPENIINASLMIFDMQGKLIKNYSVINKKEGYVEINGGDLQPGMYFYSLIVDGKEIDTKRMILTE